MKIKKYDIFLSYRRSDGKLLARLLKESLEKQGYRVFLDMDELLDGVFDERIIQTIHSTQIFMPIMTKQYFSRCNYENDWIRREIESAALTKKSIVPIQPDMRFTKFPASIPSHIKDILSTHQYAVIDTGQLYQESIYKLIRDRIQPVIKYPILRKLFQKINFS